MSRPNRITVSQSRRGTTVKASGLAAQALFDALTGKAGPDLAATPPLVPFPGPCTVHFEDCGQDFLEWDLDAEGVVVESRYQASVWVGCRVLNVPEVGKCLAYVRAGNSEQRSIRYPVLRVVRRVSLAVQSGGTGC